MSYVTFTSDTGITVTVGLGEASPIITNDSGGWEVVDRPKRTGLTRFRGKDPIKQDIQVMFDGWADNQSVEDDIQRLQRMCQQPNPLAHPPLVTLDGMVHRTDLVWVIESVDWDANNAIWDRQSGQYSRLRQAATVHMLQFVDDNVIITPPSPAVKAKDKKKDKVIVVPQGMSLRQIAMWAYGDPNKYFDIWLANPFLNPDPRKVIPAGTHIVLPGIGPFTVTAGVPGYAATP